MTSMANHLAPSTDPIRGGEVLRLGDRSPLRSAAAAAAGDGWYVYQRLAARRRGSYVGPFDGPDAALRHLRNALEIELLRLFDAPERTTSTFRVVRRPADQRAR